MGLNYLLVHIIEVLFQSKSGGNVGIWECNTEKHTFEKLSVFELVVDFPGCYISKCEYFREGEKSLDRYYRPFHVVQYYRYVRFFPDGKERGHINKSS